MDRSSLGPLRFKEQVMERIWGGRRLSSILGKPLPEDLPIGEAWLISDHPSAESEIAEGLLRGFTIRDLVESDPDAILGLQARLTVHGRFPLLLKILDSSDWLSVQVHPDDACAARLGEPDVGKTEMWHVLHADPGSELICGLDPALTAAQFEDAARNGTLDALMPRFTVEAGDSVLVRAGTVHAIGGGIVLAEIQQNSDLTYRIHDWGRVDSSGKPRALHLDKALSAIHFGSHPQGKSVPLALAGAPSGGSRELLGVCQYFAAERVHCPSSWHRDTRSASFHILLCIQGGVKVAAGSSQTHLEPGQACLVPGALHAFDVDGPGAFLDYYVPDLTKDVRDALHAAGHSPEAIARLVSAANAVPP